MECLSTETNCVTNFWSVPTPKNPNQSNLRAGLQGSHPHLQLNRLWQKVITSRWVSFSASMSPERERRKNVITAPYYGLFNLFSCSKWWEIPPGQLVILWSDETMRVSLSLPPTILTNLIGWGLTLCKPTYLMFHSVHKYDIVVVMHVLYELSSHFSQLRVVD